MQRSKRVDLFSAMASSALLAIGGVVRLPPAESQSERGSRGGPSVRWPAHAVDTRPFPRPAAVRRTGAVLVAVAHPDDETLMMGGTLARLAHEGRRVVVVCATRGEAGAIADEHLATRATLGEAREQELIRACQSLGIARPIVLSFPDGGLQDVDPRDLAERFGEAIRGVGPCVVVTWGADGGYGHPDHIAVHAAATTAFFRTTTEVGGPGALYYVLVRQPRLVRLVRRVKRLALARGRSVRPNAASLRPTTYVDVACFSKARLAAMREYRSQLPADLWLRGVSGLLSPRNNFAFSRVERFSRAYPALRPDEPAEQALWTGSAPPR
ncbi:MAG TPA: PIG-L family deacetylase [Dehalococcoidia bacterium]|nr:PIG-L family deacetylase [Dehalococcoidia bacterium]